MMERIAGASLTMLVFFGSHCLLMGYLISQVDASASNSVTQQNQFWTKGEEKCNSSSMSHHSSEYCCEHY